MELAKQYDMPSKAMERGGEPLNHARCSTTPAWRCVWERHIAGTEASELQKRRGFTALANRPRGACGAGLRVDVQGDRLEKLTLGIGGGMERWVVDHWKKSEFMGRTQP